MLIQDSKVITYIPSSLCLPEKDVSLRPCQETQPLCRINLFIVTEDKILNIFWKWIQIESIDSFFLGLWKLVAGAFIELARSISRFIQTLKSRTGRSLLEPLILGLSNPKIAIFCLIEQSIVHWFTIIQYMKITSSEHVV